MVFDDNGNLLYASDGGVYRLSQPTNAAARQWRFLSAALNDVEFFNVEFDPLSKVIIGGTQDNGTPIQAKPGSGLWDASNTSVGDGGYVAVDADQTSHPGTSIRYTSTYYLYNFYRSTWDANNNFLGSSPVGLQIVAGPDAGQTLSYLNPYMQFYNPIVLNSIDPTRLLIGTATLYESFDQGDTLTNRPVRSVLLGNRLFRLIRAGGVVRPGRQLRRQSRPGSGPGFLRCPGGPGRRMARRAACSLPAITATEYFIGRCGCGGRPFPGQILSRRNLVQRLGSGTRLVIESIRNRDGGLNRRESRNRSKAAGEVPFKTHVVVALRHWLPRGR
jgi:hypothetical protein